MKVQIVMVLSKVRLEIESKVSIPQAHLNVIIEAHTRVVGKEGETKVKK